MYGISLEYHRDVINIYLAPEIQDLKAQNYQLNQEFNSKLLVEDFWSLLTQATY